MHDSLVKSSLKNSSQFSIKHDSWVKKKISKYRLSPKYPIDDVCEYSRDNMKVVLSVH